MPPPTPSTDEPPAIAIIAVTRRGAALAERIAAALPQARAYVPDRFAAGRRGEPGERSGAEGPHAPAEGPHPPAPSPNAGRGGAFGDGGGFVLTTPDAEGMGNLSDGGTFALPSPSIGRGAGGEGPSALSTQYSVLSTRYSSPAGLVGWLFPRVRGLVLVLATGAAVRLIAPHLRDKRTDPAVVTVDDAGRYAIALLSGHLGGANELAARVAAAIGALPVITTASDAHGLPAADLIGAAYGWRVENPTELKPLAAALVNGDAVGVWQEAGERDWHGGLPAHSVTYTTLAALFAAAPAAAILISDRVLPAAVERPGWVRYRPRSLVLGVGCSRGASEVEIAALVEATLAAHALSPLSVRELATIDLKADEPGLLAFARAHGLPLRFFPAAALDATPGQETPSEVVHAAVGTGGVCEPAALLAAGADRLLVPKHKSRTVTVAVARAVLDRP